MSKKNQPRVDKQSILETFEWPEYNSDSKRIKMYSKKYKDLSVVEAFEDAYKMKIGPMPEIVNLVPNELRVGDMISTHIIAIDKNKVTFDTANIKNNVVSSINLYKFDKFKHFLPMDTIDAVVTKVERDKVTIDPISPMVNRWMDPILKDPDIQKVMPNEETGEGPKPILVKNLQLTRGGFMGKAVIPTASEFVGEDYTVDAFIPGSQIVLNITDDFNQFVGKTVQAFVVNYMAKPGTKDEMTLICSAKEVIKFAGEINMIYLFNSWCEESELWKKVSSNTYVGKVTGVINTSKKCGVFIEVPELSITGMVATKPEELVNYKPHSNIDVKITGFDEETYYDNFAKQMQHVDPYQIENGILRKCNLKPNLEFA